MSSSLGFTIQCEDGKLLVCQRRKSDEHLNGTPIIGDIVTIDDSNQVCGFLPRKNLMLRPRIANVDQAGVIISCKEPSFQSFLLDKYLTATLESNVPAFIIITKWDLLKEAEIKTLNERLEAYEKLGYTIYRIGKNHLEDIELLKEKLSHKVSFFMGQTGVGKSTLMNLLDPQFERKIGDYEAKFGRGQHKTKEVALFKFLDGFLADTPGFSDFQLTLPKEELAIAFPGYQNFYLSCKFKGCLHNGIKGCAVEKAVEEGLLSKDSYGNYLTLLSEANTPLGFEKKSSHDSYSKERKKK